MLQKGFCVICYMYLVLLGCSTVVIRHKWFKFKEFHTHILKWISSLYILVSYSCISSTSFCLLPYCCDSAQFIAQKHTLMSGLGTFNSRVSELLEWGSRCRSKISLLPRDPPGLFLHLLHTTFSSLMVRFSLFRLKLGTRRQFLFALGILLTVWQKLFNNRATKVAKCIS